MFGVLFVPLFVFAARESQSSVELRDILHNAHTEHTNTLIHTHEHLHKDQRSGEFASIRYNATKCSENTYIVIDNAEKVECFSTNVIHATFKTDKDLKDFVTKAKKGAVLMSHHKLPCFENNESVLLRISSAKVVNARIVEISGAELQPFELFRHIDAEFSTNMLSKRQAGKCEKQPGERMHTTSFDADHEIDTNQANYSKEAYVGPWKVPLPSDIFWQDPSAARMFCIDCSMHFFPVIKFKIRIVDYQLEEFVLTYESSTLLELEPHVAFDVRESSQTRELFKEYLEELLKQFRLTFHVGGVPIEIDPGMRIGVFMFSIANIDAHIGYKASLLGSFKGGIEYDSKRGLQRPASAHFHSVPQNYKAMLGKQCKLYSKPRGEIVEDIAQCANLCDNYVGCKHFSFDIHSNFCTLTKECEEEINTSTSTMVFESFKWDAPEPDPELKGMVSFGFMPEIYLRINRIGGPNLALSAAQSVQLFSYNMKSKCSVSSVSTKINYLVGGNIHLKVGQTTLLQMEEYLHPIYSQSLPISGAIQTCDLSNVKLPEISLPLPWLSEPEHEPRSLDDAMEQTRLVALNMPNTTVAWSTSQKRLLKNHLHATLKQSTFQRAHIAPSDGSRFSKFFTRIFSWMKSKLGTG